MCLLSSLFLPSAFNIFIFILIYLITAIPPSSSLIPSSSLPPSVHPLFQSSLSPFSSHIQSNSSPCFILRKPPHLDVLSLTLSIHPLVSLSSQINFISKALLTKLLCENCFTNEEITYFHSSICPSFNLSIHPFIHPSMSPHCFTLNISPLQRWQVLSITSTHRSTYSMCTHTQTLKYRASSDPNRRKGDGG